MRVELLEYPGERDWIEVYRRALVTVGKDTVNLSDCSECFSCVNEPHCDGCNWAKHLIVCNVNLGGCGAASGLYDTKEKAIEAWNRRTYDNY